MKTILTTAAILLAAPAIAAPITFQFTAERNQLRSNPLPGSTAEAIRAFENLSGTFTYDTDAADSLPTRDDFGNYVTGSFTLDQVDLGAPIPRTERTLIQNDRSGEDGIRVSTYYSGVRLFLNMQDTTGSVFNSDALPTSFFFGDFDRNLLFNVSISGDSSASTATYDLTSLEPVSLQPVPLPAGLPLLAAGIVGLGLLSRRKRVHAAA